MNDVKALLDRILATGGIAGVIALMISSAILYRYLKFGPGEQIPDVLSHAFTTILGFYFGAAGMTGVTGRRTRQGSAHRTKP
jgi:hypothetical protein